MISVIHILLNKLNGGLYDAFEYYSMLKSINNNVKLIYLTLDSSIDKSYIINSFYDRYKKQEYINDIIYMPINKIINYKFNKVLLVDNHTPKKINLIRADKFYILADILNIENDNVFYNNILNNYNCCIYNEFSFINLPINYKFKFNFSLYKSIDNANNNILYNSNSKGLPTIEELDILHSYLEKGQTLYIICKLTDNYKKYKYNDVKFLPFHPTKYFELFSTALYYHFGKRFDPRPRIFHECKYYNKNVIYINNYNIKDGSWYRYYDAYIKCDINERYLDRNDSVINDMLT